VEAICNYCKKEFVRIPSLLKRYKHTFCSRICYGKYLVGKRSPKRFYPRERSSDTIVHKYGNLRKRALAHNWKYPSSKEFVEWYKSQEKKCSYCDIPFEYWEILYKGHQNKYSLTVDRKDNSKGYSLENLVLACSQCNIVKNNVLTHQEMKEISQKYIKPKWQIRMKEVKPNVQMEVE